MWGNGTLMPPAGTVTLPDTLDAQLDRLIMQARALRSEARALRLRAEQNREKNRDIGEHP